MGALARGPRRLRRALRIAADAEEYTLLQLIQYAAARIHADARMLDAGAGRCFYRRYFPHVRYESCDIGHFPPVQHDYVCDLQELPMGDDSFDAVLCTQVLDDLPYPQRAVNEFYRVLKPGGSLFLTAPMSGRIHGEPHHFFHFTNYGLELMFRNAGFVIESILPKGGYFLYLSYMLRRLPAYFLRQYQRPPQEASGVPARVLRRLANGSLYGAYLLALPVFRYALPWMLFCLDGLDRQRAFTLGYRCHCRKPAAAA